MRMPPPPQAHIMKTDPTLFQGLLGLFQHNLTTAQQVDLFKRLAPFGEVANGAMRAYLASAPSPFFDWSHLIKLLRQGLLQQMGLPKPVEIWGYITNELTKTSPYHPLVWPELVGQVVNALGGSQVLRASTNDMADRARAQTIYKELLDDYITEQITSTWHQT